MMVLHRRDDWRGRLAKEMARQQLSAFAWGKTDCAIGFIAGVIEAITGEDVARGYRGKYRSARSALRLLKEAGAESLGDFAAQKLPEIAPHEARVGDIGILETDGPVGQAFCMVDASTLVVMTESDGVGRRPRTDMIRAFRVGE